GSEEREVRANMNLSKLPRLTFWRAVLVVVLLFGAAATYYRYVYGLGASTHLSDAFPWGIWIGFDILCGVMLAAGGFTLMAAVHVLNIKKYKPVGRPALLTAFLGYILVVSALMFDLGKPYNVWHPIVMWQPRSVMFEVGWCVMLYTTVLALEFAPIVFERLRYEKPMRILRMFSVPILILGVILSTLHQSSLGSLYLIVPGKLYPLWYTTMLPVLFYVSAICIGIAMTIFESMMSARHFGHALEAPVIRGLGRGLLIAVLLYTVVRFQDLIRSGRIAYAFVPTYEATLFWIEIALALAIPIVMLLIPKIRENPISLYLISIFVVSGFVLNRLNVAVTGMERSAGVRYIPKWSEIAITLSIVGVGITVFTLAVKYLPIFGHDEHEVLRPENAVRGTAVLPATARARS
ncbi:MAG TPA: Ni/Fe-hydrogenase cytochrome b subunit, partial [Thermoanaerobaculia bacterium]|nr:Ni/Fe-hydrogenase cytochrome b subunit [Thermoanaerobaculia bacterium]